MILGKKLIEKVLNGTHVDITIRALDVYIGHQNDVRVDFLTLPILCVAPG